MVKDSNTRIMVTLKKDTLDLLKNYADKYGLSLSAVVQIFIINELDQKGYKSNF